MARSAATKSLNGAVVLLALSACAPSTPAPPPPPTPVTLFAYQPFDASYLFVSRGQTDQTMPDGTAASTTYAFMIGLSAYVTATADGMEATVRVDSVPVLEGAASLVAGNIRRAVGRSVTAHMLRTGELVSAQALDPSLGTLPQVAGLLREFFPRIPDEGVEVGDTWSDTTETSTYSNGLDIAIDAVRRYDAQGWTQWAGRRSLEIAADVRYTMSGGGAMSGQTITLSGSGARSERYFLADDGSFVGSVVRDSSTADATLDALGMTIPVRQSRTDTLRVIR